MANRGKYTDRNPTIRSAGKVLEPTDTVGDSLQIYSQEEAAENMLKLKCKTEEKPVGLGFSTFLPTDTLKDLLILHLHFEFISLTHKCKWRISPELKKSRFVAFREKFAEDMFFKKPELGKVYPSQSKPKEFNNENFTYGAKMNKSESVYELVLPQKTAEQINREYINWHDMYIISHNHYFPSEKIKRNYNYKFNSNSTFGMCNKVDKTGKIVKSCLEPCDRMEVITKAQKNFIDRTIGRLGQRINRYDLNLDPITTFGIVTNRPDCDVRSLIENVEPNLMKTQQVEAISHINQLRRFLFNRSDFHMYDLKSLLQTYDKENTGYITYESIFKTLRSLLINTNEEKVRLAGSHYKIVIDENQPTERVNLDKFWKMLHIQYPLPRKGVKPVMPQTVYNSDTTYRVLCKDRNKSVTYHKLLEPIHRSTDQTNASDVISPNIPMQFDLVSSDFEILRKKDELKKIFKGLMVDNEFDNVWKFAKDEINGDNKCKMSVNNLRAAMNIYKSQNLN